jgi:hypothetical protein
VSRKRSSQHYEGKVEQANTATFERLAKEARKEAINHRLQHIDCRHGRGSAHDSN